MDEDDMLAELTFKQFETIMFVLSQKQDPGMGFKKMYGDKPWFLQQ